MARNLFSEAPPPWFLTAGDRLQLVIRG